MADAVLPLIGRFFPRFELSDIECGHWVISEKPNAFKKGKRKLLLPNDYEANDRSCDRILTGEAVKW